MVSTRGGEPRNALQSYSVKWLTSTLEKNKKKGKSSGCGYVEAERTEAEVGNHVRLT